MKVCGRMMRQMVLVEEFMKMEGSMRVNGRMGSLMAMGYASTQMDEFLLETGLIAGEMVWASKHGQVVKDIVATTEKENMMVRVATLMQMEAATLVTSKMTLDLVTEGLSGQMVIYLKVSGTKVREMEREFTH